MTIAEPWPIDRYAGTGPRQRVLIEAEVYDGPDPEDDNPDTRFYVFTIANGDPNVQGRELLSIREDHIRQTVRRMPTPAAEPAPIAARLLRGFEIEICGEWHEVQVCKPEGDAVWMTLDNGWYIGVPADARIPARLTEE